MRMRESLNLRGNLRSEIRVRKSEIELIKERDSKERKSDSSKLGESEDTTIQIDKTGGRNTCGQITMV